MVKLKETWKENPYHYRIFKGLLADVIYATQEIDIILNRKFADFFFPGNKTNGLNSFSVGIHILLCELYFNEHFFYEDVMKYYFKLMVVDRTLEFRYPNCSWRP